MEYVTCVCVWLVGERGEWMRELGLGFTNPFGTGGVLDMCLCFGCGGVGGELVGGLDTVKNCPLVASCTWVKADIQWTNQSLTTYDYSCVRSWNSTYHFHY